MDLSNNNYPHTYYDSVSPFIKSIIDTEGPILESDIIKRIGEANGVKRCGNVIQENLR